MQAGKGAGVSAAAYNSALTPDEMRQVRHQLQSGELKLLYVAPDFDWTVLRDGVLEPTRAGAAPYDLSVLT